MSTVQAAQAAMIKQVLSSLWSPSRRLSLLRGILRQIKQEAQWIGQFAPTSSVSAKNHSKPL